MSPRRIWTKSIPNMSLEYTTFTSDSKVLSPKRIQSATESWRLLFIAPSNLRPLPHTKPFPDYCWVIGTCSRSKNTLTDYLPPLKQCKPLPSTVGVCELSICRVGKVDAVDLSHVPSRYRAAVAMSSLRYETRTSAGRNLTSVTLQRQLCLLMARVVGAVVEDPQRNTFRMIRKRGSRASE